MAHDVYIENVVEMNSKLFDKYNNLLKKAKAPGTIKIEPTMEFPDEFFLMDGDQKIARVNENLLGIAVLQRSVEPWLVQFCTFLSNNDQESIMYIHPLP